MDDCKKFMNLVIEDNAKNILDYVISNGKRKPFCPIIFINKEFEQEQTLEKRGIINEI